MIRIEHISFGFTLPDEESARGLYADWDGFCRRCFERVAEECLAPYGDDQALHELERLDLDLGNIPEEDLYDEFPRRLREALAQALPPLHGRQPQAGSDVSPGVDETQAASRIANLLFYLEYGYPLPEWADPGFRVQEEIDRLVDYSASSYNAFIREAALLCLRREHALRRLSGQTEPVKPLLDLYAAALAETSAGQTEKRRLLALLLDTRPDIPLRFVHTTGNDTRLREMSLLLDTRIVRQLIRTETQEHAEVDLPPYWHYLYEWLIRYYPYNGIAIFGSKAEFTRHLHHRLLTFIHKRDGAPYLSKEELTVGFLLEVFGAAYYRDVLNAIYRLQPHNPDGSPVYDNHFNRELYRIFLRLSLLRLPGAVQDHPVSETGPGRKDTDLPADTEGVTALLRATRTGDGEQRRRLSLLVRNHPEVLVRWLRSEGVKNPELLSALAGMTDRTVVDRLLVSLSLAVWEQAARTENHIRRYKADIPWLKEVPDAVCSSALRRAVFMWIGRGHYHLTEAAAIRRLLLALRNELDGTDGGAADGGPDRGLEKLSAAIRSGNRPFADPVDMDGLAGILKDPARSDAGKRMLWTMLVREQPEELIQWFRSAYAKDNTLLPLLAELAEDTSIDRLFAAFSAAASDRRTALRHLLERVRNETVWLQGVSDTRLASAFRRSALHLLAGGDPARADHPETMLRLVYREVTGGTMSEEAVAEISVRALTETYGPAAPDTAKREIGEEPSDLQYLRRIVYDPSLPEAAKRRAVARYWDSRREHAIETVLLLHEQNMLDEVLKPTGTYIWENLLSRILRQTVGMEKTAVLLPVCCWLADHAALLAPYYRTDAGLSLRTGLLLGIVRLEPNGRYRPLKETVHSLFAALFREESFPAIRKEMLRDTSPETTGDAAMEQSFAVFDVAADLPDGGTGAHPFSRKEVSRMPEEPSGRVEAPRRERPAATAASEKTPESRPGLAPEPFENRWNTAEDFAKWLEDTSVPTATKRDVLREAAFEKPRELLRLLRAQPRESRASAALETLMSAREMLQAVAGVNFHLATVLSGIMDRLRHPATNLPLSLTRGHIPLETLLQQVLSTYMQDPEMPDRSWNRQEITGTFLRLLRQAAAGTERDDTDDARWRLLAGAIAGSGSESIADRHTEHLQQLLADPSVTHAAVRQILDPLMERQPESVLAWLEREAGLDSVTRMAEATDALRIGHWADYLTRTPGFAHPDAFRRLTRWLLQRVPAGKLASALFLYVKEPGWKTLAPEQMEAYLFSRLSIAPDGQFSPEVLTDTSLPEDTRKRLFRRYLRHRPERLLAFLREAVSRNIRTSDEWLRWTETSDWLFLAASLSLARAELFRQITESLSLPEAERKSALATHMLSGDTTGWPYSTPRETLRDFIGMLPSLREADAGRKEETVRRVAAELALSEAEVAAPEPQPEFLTTGHAGLCLLAPWFVRLFAMLGYLDEERKSFRNTALKVRAVFLLQYLACGEDKAWREAELAFNRLLTALPGHVPLPQRLPLTDEERQIADGMVAGVKANWPQMNGTSVEGFRQSFIVRNGRLEQEKERWLLTVEEKAYDILLEGVPWGFRQIRLPWLKRYVQVTWHEKQTF